MTVTAYKGTVRMMDGSFNGVKVTQDIRPSRKTRVNAHVNVVGQEMCQCPVLFNAGRWLCPNSNRLKLQ